MKVPSAKNTFLSFFTMLLLFTSCKKEIHNPFICEQDPLKLETTILGDSVILDVLGGIPPYSYSLDGEVYSENNIYSGVTPCVYQSSVKDSVGCSANGTVLVQPLNYPCDSQYVCPNSVNVNGHNYKVVQINCECWMVENLNEEIGNSVCYGNNADNCNQYGRLYDWVTASTACPSGWRLPSDCDFMLLEQSLGMEPDEIVQVQHRGGEGLALKNGDFRALTAGAKSDDGTFMGLDKTGYFWTSTEYGQQSAWFRAIYADELCSPPCKTIYRYVARKEAMFSCRCVKWADE